MPGSFIISCREGVVNGVLIGCLRDYCRMRTLPMSSCAKSERFSRPNDFRQSLLAWYDAHARDLPWRRDRDPYRVWVSEIMLQQTRVAAVIEHYHEFLRRFPTVQKLAAAKESAVLAAWSGLGYYRRARMLHAAAKFIVRERNGEFPKTSEKWRDLPGIGRYTAAAIASISLGEPVAVVDGNVERVLQRVYGMRFSGEDFWRYAADLLDRERPGDFNQAMMELGATICTPKSPSCLTCPVMQLCSTRGERQFGEAATRQMKLEIDVALRRRNGSVFLVQRPQNARLMAGMWELPQIDAKVLATGPKSRSRNANGRLPIFSVHHSITVTDYTVRVWDSVEPESESGRWVSSDRLSSMPLTGLTRKILLKAGVWISTSRKMRRGPSTALRAGSGLPSAQSRNLKSDHLKVR
jgi:A/G-specific adenine glycosylase